MAFRAAAGLALVVCAFAGGSAPVAVAQMYDFTLEPGTGSIWISSTQFILNGAGNDFTVAAAWREDGKVERIATPFSPFTYQNPRSPASDENLTVVGLGGRFGVLAQDRGLYRRNSGGAWTVSDALDVDPNRFGCHETPQTPACIVISMFKDSRGLDVVVLFDEGENLRYLWQDGDRFRPPRGAEKNLSGFDFISPGDLIWSDDGASVIVPNGFGPASNGYTVVTESGRTPVSLSLGTPSNAAVEAFNLTKRGGHSYASQMLYDPAVGLKIALYGVDNLFAAAPAAILLFQATADASEQLTPIGMDAGFFYYQLNQQIMAVDAATLTGKPGEAVAKTVGTCATIGSSNIRDEAQVAGQRIWWTCGFQLVRLESGVASTITAAGPIASGTVLKDEGGGAFDLALGLRDQTIQRIKPDGSSSTINLAPPNMQPSLAPVWEEASGICGVETAEDDTQKVVCQRGGTWSAGADRLPAPFATMHAGPKTWALSQVGDQVKLYALADGTGGAGAWKEVQSWPWTPQNRRALDQPVPVPPAPPQTTPLPQFIPQGVDRFALDFGDGQLWVSANGGPFTPSYPHPSQGGFISFNAGMSEDGILYDLCTPTAPYQDPPLCAYRSDGTFTVLTALPTSVDFGAAYPMKRGALVVAADKTFVVRGTRAIELGHLYGQFEGDSDQPVGIESRDLGGGNLLIRRQVDDPSSGNETSTYFQYDGEALTQLPWTDHQQNSRKRAFFKRAFHKQALARKHRHRGPRDVPSGTGNAGETAGGSALQTWRGADGIWRAIRNDITTAFVYGENPVDASYSNLPGSPDNVNGAVRAGDDVLLATDAGLWTCPRANATPVTAGTEDLPTTDGCALKVPLPFVHAVRRVAGATFAQNGAQIVRIHPGDQDSDNGSGPRVERLSSAPAHALGADGLRASWVEDGAFVRYNPVSGSRLTLPLPDGVTATGVVATSPRWLCADAGLFWLTALHGWQMAVVDDSGKGEWKVESGGGSPLAARLGPRLVASGASSPSPCKSMSTLSSTASPIFSTSSGSFGSICSRGHCTTPIPLPAPLLDDSSTGTLSSTFSLSLGSTLYSFDGHSFTNVTPQYAGGSLLLTPASSITGGVIALKGGGVILTHPNGDIGHIRPE